VVCLLLWWCRLRAASAAATELVSANSHPVPGLANSTEWSGCCWHCTDWVWQDTVGEFHWLYHSNSSLVALLQFYVKFILSPLTVDMFPITLVQCLCLLCKRLNAKCKTVAHTLIIIMRGNGLMAVTGRAEVTDTVVLPPTATVDHGSYRQNSAATWWVSVNNGSH